MSYCSILKNCISCVSKGCEFISVYTLNKNNEYCVEDASTLGLKYDLRVKGGDTGSCPSQPGQLHSFEIPYFNLDFDQGEFFYLLLYFTKFLNVILDFF